MNTENRKAYITVEPNCLFIEWSYEKDGEKVLGEVNFFDSRSNYHDFYPLYQTILINLGFDVTVELVDSERNEKSDVEEHESG